jgi:peptidoglycan lytic transglycosylase A
MDHHPVRSNLSFRCYVWVATILIFLLFLPACYPTLTREPSRPEDTLKKVNVFYPRFDDDMGFKGLIPAIEQNLAYLDQLPPGTLFDYGENQFTREQVEETQKTFLHLLSQKMDANQINREIRKLFRVYRATGRVGNRKVLFTGYYEPAFEARLTKGNIFRYPIYRMPDDLIKIRLSEFGKKYQDETLVGRLEDGTVLPYYTRLQIETERILAGRHLEIAWLKDPVDVAFLQIQGSGQLNLADGRTMRVGYSASNGHPYRSIGAYMVEKGYLEKDEISMQTIRKYLSEHPDLVEEILNFNPSYVFFRELAGSPLGNIGVPLTPGRSIALDAKLFPKGALAFISCEKPIVDHDFKIMGWKHFSRFVLNQDTGGAIKGAGRADLYWGSGRYAEIAAGHLKHEGELYLLIKKQ